MRASAVLLLLLLPGAADAQTLRGRVYEYLTQNTISGATIEVVGSNGERTAATSDSTGYFILFPKHAGTMTVEVTHPSYVADSSLVVTVRAKETVTLVVRMTRQAIPIAPIVVTARSASALGGFHERQRHNSFGKYIGAAEIERRQPVTFRHLLLGLQVVEVEETMGSSQLTMRSRMPAVLGLEANDRCAAAVFVDGMPMPAGFDLESLVPVSLVTAVEIYPDPTGVPSEFTTIGNDCGVVAFWTRPPARDTGPVTLKRAALAAVIIGAIILIERALLGGDRSEIPDKAIRDFTLAPALEVAPAFPLARPPGGAGGAG